jgi:hypothetical protein
MEKVKQPANQGLQATRPAEHEFQFSGSFNRSSSIKLHLLLAERLKPVVRPI